MMKRFFLIFVANLSLFPAFAVHSLAAEAAKLPHEQTSVAVLKGKRGKHHFSLRLVTGPFRKKLHRARRSGVNAWIDGKPEWNKNGSKNWYGTDGGLPYREFYSFQVKVDGRNWTIPKGLWSDCYDAGPNFKTPDNWTRLSRDGKHLWFRMYGSEGAGSYYVIWHLRANGRSTRKFQPAEC